MLKRISILHLIPIILFLFLAAPEFVQISMYNDGLWYAILGRNMSQGMGDFWSPHLTATIFPTFHEHPPLVFGLLSIFYTVLGDSIVVERLYAFIIFLLTAGVMVKVWKYSWKTAPALQRFWLIPLTLWLLNELVYHFYPANVLEPTLGFFTILAVYLLLKSIDQVRLPSALLLLVLAGSCLIGASLSKGLVGLFPLATLGIHWLVFRKYSLWDTMIRSLIVLGTLILGYVVILRFPTASESLQQYLDSQVIASIAEERTTFHHRENRLYILGRLLQVLLPAMGLSLFLFWVSLRKFHVYPTEATLKKALFFFLIGLSASFPLIISLKQSFYYLLPSLPYFAVGLGLLIGPGIVHMTHTIVLSSSTNTMLRGLTLALLLGGFLFTGAQLGGIAPRDQKVLHDVSRITEVVPSGSTIGSKGFTAHLCGYLYRKHEISLDTNSFDYPYLIIDGERDIRVPQHYKKLLEDTHRFHLYKRE